MSDHGIGELVTAYREAVSREAALKRQLAAAWEQRAALDRETRALSDNLKAAESAVHDAQVELLRASLGDVCDELKEARAIADAAWFAAMGCVP
jgi:hypothetical protein